MKILLVSYFFPPMNVIGAVRVGKFAKYLLEADHDVRVLTALDDSFPKGLAVEIPEDKIHRTNPIRVNILPIKIMRAFARFEKASSVDQPGTGIVAALGKLYRTIWNLPDGQVGWMPSALREGSKIIEDWQPDLIYASAMPFTSLMVSAKLSKRYNIPYVAELRDLWVDSHYYDYPLWRRAFETWLEKRSLERAAGVVTVSEPLADTLRAKYGIQTAVVLNGFDPDDFPTTVSRADNAGGVLRIIYTGIIYPGRRDPTPLFEALQELGDERHAFRVEFYGRRLNEVRFLANKFGVDDTVELFDQVSYDEVMAIQHDADILLLLLWDSPDEKGVYTGKLFEYLGAGRPILSLGLEDGVAAALIRSRMAGYVSNDSAQIATKLREWSALKSRGKLNGTNNGAFDDLTRRSQFSSLERFIKEHVPVTGTPRIRVDVIVNNLGVGGTERHLCQILPQLDHRLFDMSVWTLRSGGTLEASLRMSGIPVNSPPSWMPRSIGQVFRFIRLLLRFWRYPPDIVHCFLPESYLIGGLAGILNGHRRVVMSRRSLSTYHLRYPFVAHMESYLHRRSVALLGNSRAVISDLRSEADNSKIGLIYNGIDLEHFNDMPDHISARRELNIPDEAIVFVIIANLIEYKGYFDLLEAMGLFVSMCNVPWRLVCVGRDDGIGPSLRERSSRLGIEKNIVWSGPVLDVRTYLAASDIGVSCSHEEGFSNSILECMAANLPIVVTDVGGNSEAVIDGETGLVVPPKNPDRLANALVELAIDEPYRRRMGETGKERVVSKFSRDKCVKKYTEFYRHIAGNAEVNVADKFSADPIGPMADT